jgi:hypothetical protein
VRPNSSTDAAQMIIRVETNTALESGMRLSLLTGLPSERTFACSMRLWRSRLKSSSNFDG